MLYCSVTDQLIDAISIAKVQDAGPVYSSLVLLHNFCLRLCDSLLTFLPESKLDNKQQRGMKNKHLCFLKGREYTMCLSV